MDAVDDLAERLASVAAEHTYGFALITDIMVALRTEVTRTLSLRTQDYNALAVATGFGSALYQRRCIMRPLTCGPMINE